MSGSCPVSARVCQETARERDELGRALGIAALGGVALARERDEARARAERLRAGIEFVVRNTHDDTAHTYLGELLYPPTEGETDE